MKNRFTINLQTVLLSCFLAILAPIARAAAAGGAIAAHDAEINGVKLHYLTSGHGPAVILLHGYTQTSRMWRPIIPKLAERFTVIAPDLPGIGDSAIPKDGLDMKNAAIRILRWPSRSASRKRESSAMTLD
jgi:alpha-beta hydrolase superfamily lysophospholipase